MNYGALGILLVPALLLFEVLHRKSWKVVESSKFLSGFCWFGASVGLVYGVLGLLGIC